MANAQETPFGSWTSPLSAEVISRQSLKIKELRVLDEKIVWCENRPQEAGRMTLLCVGNSRVVRELIPSPFSARSRVHEYGGGAFLPTKQGIYFVNDSDQQIYFVDWDGMSVQRITHAEGRRFADLVLDEKRRRLYAVCERHLIETTTEPLNELVAIDLSDGTIVSLFSQSDFVSNPRLSPNGTELIWLAWHHPNLPWDETELWNAKIDAAGGLTPEKIYHKKGVSLFQPEWSPKNQIFFVSDESGYWNLFRYTAEGSECVLKNDSEYGLPAWVFGMSTYAFLNASEVLALSTQDGKWHLERIDTEGRTSTKISNPFTSIEGVRVSSNLATFLASSPTQSTSVIAYDVRQNQFETVRTGSVQLDVRDISRAESIRFLTEDRSSGHAFFYPPENSRYFGPQHELPPLLVLSHGGPTAATSCGLDLSIQFWTTRGFAVVDVNYGGSTGFGRKYRERLNGKWGIVDVADCISAARYLIDRGEVDPKRIAIRGGSAGGYTTLAALVFRDFFRAGASYYGVADLELLFADTHKFESKYDESLIGPRQTSRHLWRERSPLYHLDRLSCPLILFQGLDDRVVPPNQSEKLHAALVKKKIPVAYLPFPGEGHGFRRAENIQKALESEFYFYSRIFGFVPTEPLPPVTIEGLNQIHV